ncbi:MAG: hypothetical protein FWD71_01440 [Oscillospiraceae bacterium]|nr:hypothetical protein [Oscillospiraceae bacterium]
MYKIKQINTVKDCYCNWEYDGDRERFRNTVNGDNFFEIYNPENRAASWINPLSIISVDVYSSDEDEAR